jgi:hypothetical protein
MKAKRFIQVPGRFFHYEPLFTSSFSQKFNYARSGDVFKRPKDHSVGGFEIASIHFLISICYFLKNKKMIGLEKFPAT